MEFALDNVKILKQREFKASFRQPAQPAQQPQPCGELLSGSTRAWPAAAL